LTDHRGWALNVQPAWWSADTTHEATTSNYSLLLIYRSRKVERLSWPGWQTFNGRFTHISGYPSAAGRAQYTESSPVKHRRSTTVPRNQHKMTLKSSGLSQFRQYIHYVQKKITTFVFL